MNFISTTYHASRGLSVKLREQKNKVSARTQRKRDYPSTLSMLRIWLSTKSLPFCHIATVSFSSFADLKREFALNAHISELISHSSAAEVPVTGSSGNEALH